MGRRAVVGLVGAGAVAVALWVGLVAGRVPTTEVAGTSVASSGSSPTSPDASSTPATSSTRVRTSSTTTIPPSSTTTVVTVAGADVFTTVGDPRCAVPDDAVLWDPTDTVEITRFDDVGGVRVGVVEYPLPAYEGRPWSTWGQGIVADGVYLSAVGDHRGRDGRSYLYRYDPSTARLARVADLAAVAGLQDGAWGYGKVHAQMVSDPCGNVLAASYWGSSRDLEFGRGYEGDVLFVIDVEAEAVGSRGAILAGHGVPSMAAGPDGLLYVEAVDPLGDAEGPFLVLDPVTMASVARWDAPHGGFRSVLVDAAGRGHATAEPGRFVRFDPAAGGFALAPLPFGADRLRAAAPPGTDGVAYGVTEGPTRVFSLDADGVVGDLGSLPGYTTSVALSSDGRTLFAVPGAHGGAYDLGVPLIIIDTASGRRDEVGLRTIGEAAGFRLGGTYSVVADEDPRRLFITFNAARTSDDDGDRFGTVVLVVVELP